MVVIVVRFEDDCCGCDWYTCNGCMYNHELPHLYCDECQDECEKLYEYDGQELCEDCLMKIVDVEYDENGEKIEPDLSEFTTITYNDVEAFYEPECDPYDD